MSDKHGPPKPHLIFAVIVVVLLSFLPSNMSLETVYRLGSLGMAGVCIHLWFNSCKSAKEMFEAHKKSGVKSTLLIHPNQFWLIVGLMALLYAVLGVG